jgi:prevent-host-death family protein
MSMSSLDSQQPQVAPVVRRRPPRAGAVQPASTTPVSGRQTGSRIAESIPAGEFKAKCLALMDELEERGGEITITKRGRPVAKLVPFRPRPVPDLRGSILYEAEDAWEPLGVKWRT